MSEVEFWARCVFSGSCFIVATTIGLPAGWKLFKMHVLERRDG